MITNKKSFLIVLLITFVGLSACKKAAYNIGDIKTPMLYAAFLHALSPTKVISKTIRNDFLLVIIILFF